MSSKLNLILGITLIIVTLLSVIYIRHLNDRIDVLSVRNTALDIELSQSKQTNKLLLDQIDTLNEVASAYHDLTCNTNKSHEELLDEITIMDNAYKDWFDTDIPFDASELFTKDNRKN